MFIFSRPELRDLLDFRLYVEADSDVRLSRMSVLLISLQDERQTGKRRSSIKTVFRNIREVFEKDI